MKVSDKKIDTVLRHEEKYFLSFAQMQVIKSRLDATLQLDKEVSNKKSKEYWILELEMAQYHSIFR